MCRNWAGILCMSQKVVCRVVRAYSMSPMAFSHKARRKVCGVVVWCGSGEGQFIYYRDKR